MVHNLIVGFVLILALAFIVLTVYNFTAKPSDARIVMGSGVFFIEIRRGLTWDILDTAEEIEEYCSLEGISGYPLKDIGEAEMLLSRMNETIGK